MTSVARTTSMTPSSQAQTSSAVSDKRTSEGPSKFKESLDSSRGGEQSSVRSDDGARGSQDRGRVDQDGRGKQGQGEQVGREAHPRATPPLHKPHLPINPELQKKKPEILPHKGPDVAPRGLMQPGEHGKRPPGSTVRGGSPFVGDKMLEGILGQKKGKPVLRQTQTLGSRGLPSHNLQPEAKIRDPKGRGGFVLPEPGGKRLAPPPRTPSSAAGATLLSPEGKAPKHHPKLDVEAHSHGTSKHIGLGERDLGMGRGEKDFDPLKEMRDRELRVVDGPVQQKPTVELQPRVAPSENVQQAQRLTSAEIAEIVRKVESMVSKVQVSTGVSGDKQMSLTLGDGRLKDVQLNISVDKNGGVKVGFNAENVDSRNLLSENIKKLEENLQSKGLQVSELSVGSSATGRQNFANQQDQQNKLKSAQEQLEQMEKSGVLSTGSRDPRMGGGSRTGSGVGAPGSIPGGIVPQGETSANYVA